MNSCNGTVTSSRRASGFVLESCYRHIPLDLYFVIECDIIPNNRHEIPAQEIARYHSHLCNIQVDRVNDNCDIFLLLGRDVPYVHRIFDQRTGHPNAPIRLRSSLEWTVVCDVCLGSHHHSNFVNVYKTSIM